MSFATKYKNAFIRSVVGLALAATLIFGGLSMPVYADEYGCGAYGMSTYGDGECLGAVTPDQPGTPGEQPGRGPLADTGQALSFLIPALLILLGTLFLYRTRKKMKADS